MKNTKYMLTDINARVQGIRRGQLLSMRFLPIEERATWTVAGLARLWSKSAGRIGVLFIGIRAPRVARQFPLLALLRDLKNARRRS